MTLPNYKNCQILIIGMGYVGLPLAIELSNQKISLIDGGDLRRKVIGFDIDKNRVEELNSGFDQTNETNEDSLKKLLNDGSLEISSSIEGYENSDFFIVTVPTPINEKKKPDLFPLKNASIMISKLLKIRSSQIKPIVIFESTVFPGTTEDICAKLIENESGLIYNKDFFCGYSPERINPGDKNHRLTTIKKIISGSKREVTEVINNLYLSIIEAGTYITPSIKIAEAAKVIENTQRDINIALMNELSMLFKKMGIDTLDVLDAAGTKWNFLPFKPGLVGGHCIGVDPYYLTFKAEELGFKPKVILAGRETNDNMAKWVVNEILLESHKRNLLTKIIKIMILGITFKENCPDFRNTLIVDILRRLEEYPFDITIVDPIVNKQKIKKALNYDVLNDIPLDDKFNIVLCAVAHDNFKILGKQAWLKMLNNDGFFFDIKGVIPKEINPIRI